MPQCNKYASNGSHSFADKHLAWSSRWPRLLLELKGYSADVLCLQEVPQCHAPLPPSHASPPICMLYHGACCSVRDTINSNDENSASHHQLLSQVEKPIFEDELLPALSGYAGIFYGRCAPVLPAQTFSFRNKTGSSSGQNDANLGDSIMYSVTNAGQLGQGIKSHVICD